MAKATDRAASVTTLVIGKVEVPVALFSTVAKPAALKDLFTTAGPNGGVLKAREVARPVPVDELPTDEAAEPVHSDPLMVDESAAWERAAAQRVEDAPDQQARAREALAAEAEGDARSRGLAIGVDHPSDRAVTLDKILPSSGGVDGEYGRELYEEGTGEVVPPDKIRRGVRLASGRFIDCTEHLAKIDEDTHLERMEVVRGGFVDVTRVPRARVKGSYYLGAGDENAPRALRLVFEALKRKRRGAVVKLTKRSRQSLGIVGWLGDCLVLYELVWAEDFREAPARARVIQRESVTSAEVDAMCSLIEAWSGPVEVLDALRDDAIALREDLYALALAGEVPESVVDAEAIEPGDDELMAQLEASLAAVGA